MDIKIGQYYGENSIEEIHEDGDHVNLKLNNGKTIRLKKKMANAAVTDSAITLTELRERRITPVIKEILGIMLDWDISPYEPMNEVDFLANNIVVSIDQNGRVADEMAWGKSRSELTLSDIDQKIKDAAGTPAK